ncbi:HlyD family type I secretion periplasmic adaptor subunit [Blastochloris sulfoviridis]|uniref:Membrane fusion protein (MFP) family protein n=1 Tax=Blastochloris sulfoviridis TaxID=50712 RepID=A0A5M6I1F9_9HYPH|nr:HlyD family type I secretion periplasmic adaptor subunit [Blastochloris sulfoviridis]KAA5602006.1 HlyD family type I secretion periplasmic adaptor subunit [Blastochloris sulfoviridis]
MSIVESAHQAREWYSDIPRRTRTHTILGFSGLLIGFLGFGLWGGTAPIAGAVVSTGSFVATGQNRIVQHLEGGVISKIYVNEGDVVQPGQTLVLLDDTTPKAELRRLQLRQAHLVATIARLQATSEGRETYSEPEEIAKVTDDPDILKIRGTQRLLFEAHHKSMESDISALKDGINALQERIDGTTTQRQYVKKQLQLIEEELTGKRKLLESGFIRKPEVLAIARAQANLEGEIGRLTGEIGDARERIARSREQIQGIRSTVIKTSVDQMHQSNAELYDVRERLRAAQRVLERIAITAPVRGVVVKKRYHTVGGVIEPGKNILEIVPLDEELVIEVRVRPQDIDHVKLGQPASVRLTSLNRRTTPMVAGEVVYISADAVQDETRGQTPLSTADVYVARVRLDAVEAAAIEGFSPTPGMPAEVFIKTAERTFFEYLVRPIHDSLQRAFRES